MHGCTAFRHILRHTIAAPAGHVHRLGATRKINPRTRSSPCHPRHVVPASSRSTALALSTALRRSTEHGDTGLTCKFQRRRRCVRFQSLSLCERLPHRRHQLLRDAPVVFPLRRLDRTL